MFGISRKIKGGLSSCWLLRSVEFIFYSSKMACIWYHQDSPNGLAIGSFQQMLDQHDFTDISNDELHELVTATELPIPDLKIQHRLEAFIPKDPVYGEYVLFNPINFFPNNRRKEIVIFRVGYIDDDVKYCYTHGWCAIFAEELSHETGLKHMAIEATVTYHDNTTGISRYHHFCKFGDGDKYVDITGFLPANFESDNVGHIVEVEDTRMSDDILHRKYNDFVFPYLRMVTNAMAKTIKQQYSF